MSFISLEYILFFILVVPIYFILPFRIRWVLLLVASYIFYGAWYVSYIGLIILSTGIDYVVGRRLGQTPEQHIKQRKMLLLISLTTNLGILFLFKYFNFFNESIAGALQSIGVTYQASALEVLLPVGISFYTFQSMAYTIDVYRGRIQPEHHAGRFATYVAFFPQLVAGPIERANNMLPQFHKRFSFEGGRVIEGLRLILWGAFKKVVIADRLAVYVNEVYNNVNAYSGVPLLLATVFFAFQIYCDFSGYSDIAIAMAVPKF